MDLVVHQQPTYLTPAECARQFADVLLENKDVALSMSQSVAPPYLTSLLHITEMYLTCERSLFLSTVAEIGSLCSEKFYERVHYLIGFLDELIDLHSDVKYKMLITKYLDTIVYADLTDHFIAYPIVLQLQIMAIIESSDLLTFPLIHQGSEADLSKIDLFFQDAFESIALKCFYCVTARYLHNSSSRSLYRRLILRHPLLTSQQSVLRALIIGTIFLPLTCHSAYLDELYNLLSARPELLSSSNMDTFFHVLWPTGINQSYSVPRAYLSQLLIVRLPQVPKYFSQLVQISFLIHVRVPNIRVNLMHIIEPLTETIGFQSYLDQQQEESNTARHDEAHNLSVIEPLIRQVRERMKMGFRLKQLCRMKIRSGLVASDDQDILSQVNRLNRLSDIHKTYITYDLETLLTDPERFFESTSAQGAPVWNSSVPPPPVN